MTPYLISQTNKSLSDYINMRTNKTMNCSVQKEKFNPIQDGGGEGGGQKGPLPVFPL